MWKQPVSSLMRRSRFVSLRWREEAGMQLLLTADPEAGSVLPALSMLEHGVRWRPRRSPPC
jgi:hypothetical protein